MSFVALICFSFAIVSAQPISQRIVGGDVTTIQTYPFAAVVLASSDMVVFRQQCGGSILNSRSILTAAHCVNPNILQQFRVRLGSTRASSGGLVYTLLRAIIHPDYNVKSMFDSDIALLHTETRIIYIPNIVEQGSIAGVNYAVPNDDPLTAIGWGFTLPSGGPSEELKHVQVFKINEDACTDRWGPSRVTDNMICAGLLDVGGQGQCVQDFGGPLLHNGNVIVGVASFADTANCVSAARPSVNVRVSRFTGWIIDNA